ncbi:GntR family transcriptional regulator [Bradyrhizobium ontarionense]|uniref:GntR family transcriptional regulator n=1 Tax=Bradyrhizobium ontarionense TaxID=2898149 RepID=A0ABY3R3A6_9BRAD|nr:GntR family transcriptional regulator [Bradyrhizobium sp. A19]UFZ01779.1 GntR family transcriptional regulator [Bradyrhizobium sp. A19]
MASLPAPHSAASSPDRLDPSRRAAPQVFDRLRDQIIALALPPGAPLSRTALQTEFGLSSTPIRDALMRLAEEGLVDVFPQHATLVSRIDIGRAQQAQFLRQALELEIVRLLALQPASAPVDELDGLISQQRRFAKDGDFAAFTVVDNAFHARLYSAADKQELWTLVRSRSGHIDRLRRLHLPSPGKAQTILRHHKQIVEAIAAGQPDEAQAHLREHLTGTLSDLATIRSLWPDYLSG